MIGFLRIPVAVFAGSVKTPADFAVLPANLVQQLHQAAIQVDGEQILKLVEQIPHSHAELASGLTHMVDNFCFAEIITLTQPL